MKKILFIYLFLTGNILNTRAQILIGITPSGGSDNGGVINPDNSC